MPRCVRSIERAAEAGLERPRIYMDIAQTHTGRTKRYHRRRALVDRAIRWEHHHVRQQLCFCACLGAAVARVTRAPPGGGEDGHDHCADGRNDQAAYHENRSFSHEELAHSANEPPWLLLVLRPPRRTSAPYYLLAMYLPKLSLLMGGGSRFTHLYTPLLNTQVTANAWTAVVLGFPSL